MIVVRLDHARKLNGPATVIAHVSTIAAFVKLATDSEGGRIPGMRLWGGEWEDFPVGSRVTLSEGEEGYTKRIPRSTEAHVVRFWLHFYGSPVRLALADGESVSHHVCERTDEGFYAQTVYVERDENRVIMLSTTRQRDCDGLTEDRRDLFFSVGDEQGFTPSPELTSKHPEIRGLPLWQEERHECRDFTAERAGY